MSCTCRVASWKAFVQGLSQVHKVDAPAIALLRGRQSQISQSAIRFRACTVGSRQMRSLHASPRLGLADGFSSPSPKDERVINSSPTAAQNNEPLVTDFAKEIQQEQGETKSPGSQTPRANTRQRTRDGGRAHATESGPGRRQTEEGKHRQTKVERTEHSQQAFPAQARPKPEEWKTQKRALKEKFPEGWKPKKRLSPDALAGIRALNAQFPEVYTTKALADKFEVPVEAIRRILKSKWQPSVDEEQDRQERWFRRGISVWERKAALGIKPPKKWREAGVSRDPSFHEWSKKATQREKSIEEEEIRQYKDQRAQGASHRGKDFGENQSGRYLSQKEQRLLREKKAGEDKASEDKASEQATTTGKDP